MSQASQNHAIVLTDEQQCTFFEQGFVRIDQVFSPDQMNEIDAGFERLHAQADRLAARLDGKTSAMHDGARFTYSADGRAIRHIAMCGNAEPVLMGYGRDPCLLAIAAALLGSDEMDQLINQAHYKRPGAAVAFDWHQDATHRGMARGQFIDVNGKGSYVQIALAIDDETPDNGPLQFIPGSQRLGFVGDSLIQHLDESQAIAPLLKRGDIVAFGPYTAHGSQANTSNYSRRTFINGFAYPGANQRDIGIPGAARRLHIGEHA